MNVIVTVLYILSVVLTGAAALGHPEVGDVLLFPAGVAAFFAAVTADRHG